MQSSFENTQSKSTSYMSQNNPIDIEVMNREKDNLLPQNHKKVFEKVWAEVERIMSTLRSKFMTQLENPNIPLDAQEKTMG